MKKLLPLLVVLAVSCVDELPAFADGPTWNGLHPEDVLTMMAKLPPEGCLYNPGRKCGPGRYDQGPDARALAAAIAKTAPSRDVAARMATYSSYESGNDAHARGDCRVVVDIAEKVCRAKCAFQLWGVPDEVADDPNRAAVEWLAMTAREECVGLPQDERLAGLAGSCKSTKARTKVRLREQAARDAAKP